jgi:hypothetical protein
MRKYLFILPGILLILGGGYMLGKGGIPRTKRHTGHFAGMELSLEEKETIEVRSWISWLVVAGGAGLVIFGARRK